jgi:X-X-X-Leu-X-X-Gly heptad repeat protein
LIINSTTTIDDQTRLQDIINLNGKETFTLDNHILKWDAQGKDIFYRGVSEDELPIDIKVTYYLNEEEMTAKDIIGKKGNIKIRIDFNNKLYNAEKKIYTPFVVNVGAIMNNNNSNIEVNNGKVVNTGNKNVVVGIAAPGLYDSLKLEEFKELDKIEISFDTEKFSLGNIYLIATPKLLSDVDLDIFDEIDSLTGSINTIQENMNKIENGALELEEGSKKLAEGSSTISNSLKLALDSLKQLSDGSKVIDSSILQIIDKLNGVESMLEDKNITGSISSLTELRNGNDMAITKLTSVNNNLADIYNSYNLANFASEDEIKLYFNSLELDSYTIEKLVTCKSTYEGNTSLIYLLNNNNSAIDSTINSLTNLSIEITDLITELKDALTKIQGGTSQIDNGLANLTTGINKIYNGSVELKAGAQSLNEGTNTLASGISRLNSEGIKKLTSGINEYNSYSNKLDELMKLSKDYQGYGSDNVTDTIFIYKLKAIR